MHRIDTATAQKDKFGAGKNGFTRGNPQTGTPATDLDDDYFDMLQEELAGVVEATGVALDKKKRNQLLTAINKLFTSAFTSGANWVKLPDGTIIQTGVSAAGNLGAPSDVTFPIPFAVGVMSVVASFDNAVTGANDCPSFACTPMGTTWFRLMSSRVNTGTAPYARWIAIGK